MQSKQLISKILIQLLLAVALSNVGCKSRDLVFVTYTKVGVHVTATGNTHTSLTMGYKRYEGAVIPIDMTNATGDAADVASIYAAVNITNGWLRGLYIKQAFATGEAAIGATSTGGILSPSNAPAKK